MTGLVAALATLPLRAAALTGGGVEAGVDPEVLGFVLTSRFGEAALLRSAGFVLVVVALFAHVGWPARSVRLLAGGLRLVVDVTVEPRTVETALCGLGGLVLLVSYARTGHPQATSAPGIVLVLCQTVHVFAVGVWFGGVAFLAMELGAPRRDRPAPVSAQLLARFSSVAGAAVVLAMGSGLVLARSQLAAGGVGFDSPYGRALLVKLGLVALVMGLGGYNHQRLVPAIVERDDAAAWRHLRWTALAEVLVLAGGVLVATAALTSGGL